MAESFLREKLRQAPQKEGGWKILCLKKNLNAPRPSRVTPAGTSIEVQNEWEENTHTHLPLGVSRNPATEDNRCSCSSSLPGGL